MAQLATLLLQRNRLTTPFPNSKHELLNNRFEYPFCNGELG